MRGIAISLVKRLRLSSPYEPHSPMLSSGRHDGPVGLPDALSRRAPGADLAPPGAPGVWLFSDVLSAAFESRLIPLIGFFVMPWTTLAYAGMWTLGATGVGEFEWFLVALPSSPTSAPTSAEDAPGATEPRQRSSRSACVSHVRRSRKPSHAGSALETATALSHARRRCRHSPARHLHRRRCRVLAPFAFLVRERWRTASASGHTLGGCRVTGSSRGG